MKLYTEEQVIEMIEKSRQTGLTAEYLILTTTPIELPSDEKIEEKINNDIFIESDEDFFNGAIWMRNEIQIRAKLNQNNYETPTHS